MLKNPYNNLLFNHIDAFEFFLIFRVQIFLIIFPYFKRGQLPSSRHLAVVIIAPDLGSSMVLPRKLYFVFISELDVLAKVGWCPDFEPRMENQWKHHGKATKAKSVKQFQK